jgi:hypothetical protein
MERLKKRHESSRFRGTQILSIGGHIPATLEHLPDELISGQLKRDCIKRRPTLASAVVERVAVAALLSLKNERSLSLQWRTST